MPKNTMTPPPHTPRGMIHGRAASGEANLDHEEGGAQVNGFGLGPFVGPLGIFDYDDPVSIRARKYITGTHVLLEEIGIETGVTPNEVVWTKNKARLYRYRTADGAAGGRRPVPVLLIYGFVLKPYVLDLVPGNSLVEYLVDEGFDVYLLDYGISGHEDAGLSLEDFVLDYMHGAVQKILETSGAGEISLLGQSQGGTLCTMYASLFPGGPLKNLVLLSAPTEFAPRNPGPLGLWTLASRTSGMYFDPAIVPRFFGNLPTGLASQIINSASSLQGTAVSMSARPLGRRLSIYDTALRAVREWAERDVSVRSWLAVSKWVDDANPFPGETFRKWVGDFYQRDKLIKGKMKLRGHRMDINNIGCAVLNVSGKWDCTVPPAQTKATTAHASGPDKEYVSVNAGHVGMLVGPAAVGSLWPRLRDWLGSRSGQ
jgi:polyhydroxyalkanoate synthase